MAKSSITGSQVITEKQKRNNRLSSDNIRSQEEIIVNMIDAHRLFAGALEQIKQIQNDPEYWTSPELIKKVKIIMSAMYQVWGTKTVNDMVENATGDHDMDMTEAMPVLMEANNSTEKTINVEISGKGGGPIETMRRISPEDFDRYSSLLGIIKQEQNDRLIPVHKMLGKGD